MKQTNTTAPQNGAKVLRVVNFSHPLSDIAKGQLGYPTVETVKVDLDLSVPMEEQISKIVGRVKTPLDGTVPGLAIVLPGMSEATAYLIAAIHGLTGRFPAIVPLRRDDSSGVFVVASEGGQSLEKFRQAERKRR